MYFLFRGLRNRAYWRSLPQRFGFLPRSFRQTGPGAIWLHAVSVGEVLACAGIPAPAARRVSAHAVCSFPPRPWPGRATAGDKLRGLADGVFYAPVDYVFAVRRVLRALRPSVVVVAETEIWPNLFREVKRTGAGLAIVNGRISDRAFPRYRPLALVLPGGAAGGGFASWRRPKRSASAFWRWGRRRTACASRGNFKYDFEARPARAGFAGAGIAGAPRPAQVWIAASTMPPAEPGDPDEDDVVIAACQSWPPGIPICC